MALSFEDSLRKHIKDPSIIDRILNAEYTRRPGDPDQDAVNRYAGMLDEAEKLLTHDQLAGVMFDRACCKTGSRLEASRAIARDHPDASTAGRLELLRKTKYMGKPFINKDGDIETVAVGGYSMEGGRCPCWQLRGHVPDNRTMPLSYCMCCGGHFRFHYEKALGYKLRLKQVVSSMLSSGGKEPCVFIFERADGRPLGEKSE